MQVRILPTLLPIAEPLSWPTELNKNENLGQFECPTDALPGTIDAHLHTTGRPPGITWLHQVWFASRHRNSAAVTIDGRIGSVGVRLRSPDLAIVHDACDFGAEVFAMHNSIDEPVFEQEFTRLEVFRQFHPHRIANDATTRKANHGFRLGQRDVAL